MKDEEMAHGDIIIVKRGGDDHDDHHGGVWKIAFADFMTALMAFFLVMWLINASNEQTKKAVASYFNPIKLTDSTTNPKGLNNPKYGKPREDDEERTEESTVVDESEKAKIYSSEADKQFNEQAMFSDPYAVLAEIAGTTVDKAKNGESGDEQAGKENGSDSDGIGISNGASFQDPFDPSSWSTQENATEKLIAQEEEGEDQFEVVENEIAEDGKSGSFGVSPDDSDDTQKLLEEDKKSTELKMAKEEELAAALIKQQESLDQQSETETSSDKNEELARQLEEQIALELNTDGLEGLKVEVNALNIGASVTLSDETQSGMFTVGSARPTPEMVKAMAKIGKAIADSAGNVSITGHTDGRQYQSEDYDNWRLSTARAHMAYYMLVRGGMPEKRVVRIEGQADVNLKMPDDPYNAANRRIEITLRVE